MTKELRVLQHKRGENLYNYVYWVTLEDNKLVSHSKYPLYWEEICHDKGLIPKYKEAMKKEIVKLY